jgi:hypothetical protein
MPDDEKSQPTAPSPPPPRPDDWRKIAEQASTEMDPGRLLELVQDLCSKLDEQKAQRNRAQPPKL